MIGRGRAIDDGACDAVAKQVGDRFDEMEQKRFGTHWCESQWTCSSHLKMFVHYISP